MTALIAAIFIASVLGSFHCAGMCGAFLVIASGGPGGGARRQTVLQGAYHVGRLTSYMALGAAAGAAGRLVNVAGALSGIRPAAAVLAGGMMIVFAVVTLLRARGVGIARFGLPKSWLELMRRSHRVAMERPPVVRAAMIGLLTTMLPCGWLYAFAVTAAGTGSAFRGMIAMAAFWAGTLPALVTVGAGIRGALGPLGRRLPTLTVVAMLAAGVYTLTARAALNPISLVNRVQSASLSHTTQTTPACCDIHDAHR